MKSDPPSSQDARYAFFERGETNYAFTRALESGADVIEMDVWGTADEHRDQAEAPFDRKAFPGGRAEV